MQYKKIIMAVALVVGCSLGSPAQADIVSDLSSVLKSVTSKGITFACKKADFFSLDFSLRSFDGYLCKNSSIAAITQIICPTAVTDFKGSGCDGYGKATLGTQDPVAVLKKNIVTDLAAIKTLACMAAPIAPPPADAALALGCAIG